MTLSKEEKHAAHSLLKLSEELNNLQDKQPHLVHIYNKTMNEMVILATAIEAVELRI